MLKTEAIKLLEKNRGECVCNLGAGKNISQSQNTLDIKEKMTNWSSTMFKISAHKMTLLRKRQNIKQEKIYPIHVSEKRIFSQKK